MHRMPPGGFRSQPWSLWWSRSPGRSTAARDQRAGRLRFGPSALEGKATDGIVEEEAPDIDEDNYKLLIEGLVDDKRPWTLDRLYALPQETQITRLVCVEGWSAIGKWTGPPLRQFLRRIGADKQAKYVHFVCAEGYSSSVDMATALHPQTQLTFKYDGAILPSKYGFPMRVRIPTKLGFKNPKHVIGLAVLNNYTGGYWEDQGYNWFSGL